MSTVPVVSYAGRSPSPSACTRRHYRGGLYRRSIGKSGSGEAPAVKPDQDPLFGSLAHSQKRMMSDLFDSQEEIQKDEFLKKWRESEHGNDQFDLDNLKKHEDW